MSEQNNRNSIIQYANQLGKYLEEYENIIGDYKTPGGIVRPRDIPSPPEPPENINWELINKKEGLRERILSLPKINEKIRDSLDEMSSLSFEDMQQAYFPLINLVRDIIKELRDL